jgi:hypothetical protein
MGREGTVVSSSTRTTIRRFVAAVSVAGAVLAASGCSGAGIDAGAAAIVGDRRISVAELQTATEELNMLPGLQQSIDQRSVLSFLITEPYFVQAAVDKGVGVSVDDAKTFLVQDNQWVNTRTKSVEPSPSTLDFVQTFLARQKLFPQQDGSGPTQEEAVATLNAISTQLQGADISVNPRYGTLETVFDPQGQGVFPVNPSDPDWLVKSAAEPAATLPPAP